MSNETESSIDDKENILKILVATDCHIGYGEKDPIRNNDSFNTFEEILKLAQEHKVDMILFGGDLFHENKPSRRTIHKTLSLLRKYCLGDKECHLEFLSDPTVNFAHCDYQHVNYQDPNFNIAYPVFSVHGNHDDPTGEFSLSAIDILSTAGLLNHFGKPANCDAIDISPVLLKKGNTKLALFGLGALRDERLHKTFCQKKVKMLRPREDPDSWFNIFVIHQNRAKHGPKNHIPESFLDEFLDLVIWGHEHECLIDPTWSESAKPFYISQPGSSIATSLSEGEAKQKHVGVLQIHGKSFLMTKYPLKTVRQFMMADISLSERDGLREHDNDAVYSYLTEKVEAMIEEAEEKHTGDPNQPTMPLIRIKVEYSGGYDIVNPHRFGQQFVDRVANCKDILHFYRKRANIVKDKKDFVDGPEFHSSQSNTVSMEDLINQYLNAEDEQLQLNILSERKLSKALNEFVLKDEKDAIPELVRWQLRKTQEELNKRNINEDTIIDELERVKQSKDEIINEEKENEEIEQVLASARSRTNNSSAFPDFDDDIDDINDEMIGEVPKKARGRGGRGSCAGKTNKSENQRGSRGGGRARGRAAKSQNIQESFLSTARNKTANNTTMYDNDDGCNSTRRTQKGRSFQQSIELSDDDDESNPFIDPPSKRTRR